MDEELSEIPKDVPGIERVIGAEVKTPKNLKTVKADKRKERSPQEEIEQPAIKKIQSRISSYLNIDSPRLATKTRSTRDKRGQKAEEKEEEEKKESYTSEEQDMDELIKMLTVMQEDIKKLREDFNRAEEKEKNKKEQEETEWKKGIEEIQKSLQTNKTELMNKIETSKNETKNEIDGLREKINTMDREHEKLAEQLKETNDKIEAGPSSQKVDNPCKEDEKIRTDMKWIVEEREREKRRRNIVISGLDQGMKGKEGLENWMRDRLAVNVRINRIWTIRTNSSKKGLLGTQCATIEEKDQVMRNKNKLGEEKIYIENDTLGRRGETRR